MSGDASLREEPMNLVERAAEAGMAKIAEVIEAADATVEHMYVLVYASGVPTGEQDVTSAAQGFDDSREFAAELMQHAVAALQAHGLQVAIMPIPGEPTRN